MTEKYVPSPEAVEQGLYVAYAALSTMAVVPIYFGSFGSLKKWKNPKDAKKKKTDNDEDDEDSDDEDSASESMSLQDAYMFPLFGSITLFGLYLVFRYVDKTYVNYLLTAYFGALGVMATTQVGVNCVAPFVNLLGIKVDKWHLTLNKKKKEIFSTKFTILHLIMMVASALLSGYYIITKNWIASNAFGISFAINAIQLLSLDSFQTGMILLSGLFVYDIFWVFGTEVMVSVAKNFDAPVKVVFPRLFFGLPASEAYQFAMLGLGDIVIPGVFLALCLRFDQHLAGTKNPDLGRSTRFSKPYFTASFIAYVLGLGTTIYVMHVFKAAQPALLYLSPACILSVLITGLARGEIKEVFAYTSEELEAEKAKKEADKKEADKKKADDEKEAEDKETKESGEKPSSSSDSEQDGNSKNSSTNNGDNARKARKRKGGKTQKK